MYTTHTTCVMKTVLSVNICQKYTFHRGHHFHETRLMLILTYACVHNPLPDRSFEETGAAIAAVDAVVFTKRLVAAH